MSNLPPPDECYSAMGFSRHNSEEPCVDAKTFRALLDSQRLEDIRRRTLIRRDQEGQPLVDEGYVVGHIPPLNLAPAEVEKLLSSLTEGMLRGCTTAAEWRKLRGS